MQVRLSPILLKATAMHRIHDTGLSLKCHLEILKIRIFKVQEDGMVVHEMLSFCAHDVRVLCLPRTFSCSCFSALLDRDFLKFLICSAQFFALFSTKT